MKYRARRSEPQITKRQHNAVPPSCEFTPFSDFLLASLCLSQADGAARAACPVRAEEAARAPPVEWGLAVLPDAATVVAGAWVAHVPLCAVAPDVAAEVASFPLGGAAETARSVAVVA